MNTVIAQNRDWIESTWSKIDRKLRRTAVKSRDKIPYTTINGIHDDKMKTDSTWWTNGFWGGMMWLMYEATNNEEYRKTAERSEELLDDALKQYKKLHHDVGFMWHLTSGASYRLTGNEASCTRNLFAASTLFSRYNISGDYIRAWNGQWGGSDNAGYSIIDCLMNLSLLYWASEEIGDDRFKKIAMRQMEMAMRDHIRPDGSVNHIVDHEIDKVGVAKFWQGRDTVTPHAGQEAWRGLSMVLSFPISMRANRNISKRQRELPTISLRTVRRQTIFLPSISVPPQSPFIMTAQQVSAQPAECLKSQSMFLRRKENSTPRKQSIF